MNDKLTREQVLEAFAVAADRPSPALVRQWTQRHPEFAHDIVDYATEWAALVLVEHDSPVYADLENTLLNRTMSRVQQWSRAHAKQVQIGPSNALFQGSLEAVLEQRLGPTWRDVLRIDDSILALVETRMLRPPVPRRFLEGIAGILGTSLEAFREWLFQESSVVIASYSKAPPKFEPWTFEKAVEQSTLSPEIKREWLRDLA